MTTAYRDRAREGAALLDRARPGWAGEVAPDLLAMDSCDRCILGQLYGHYFDGLERLAVDSEATAFDLGFYDGDHRNNSLYRRLAAAWRAEIRARLEGRPTS